MCSSDLFGFVFEALDDHAIVKRTKFHAISQLRSEVGLKNTGRKPEGARPMGWGISTHRQRVLMIRHVGGFSRDPHPE